MTTEPGDNNQYLGAHAQRIIASYHHWTQRHLIAPELSRLEQARTLFHARFVVLSHNTGRDPLLNYGNRAGLDLFEMTWSDLIVTPSRLTAEPLERDERARLLDTVTRHGFIDNYAGIRISKNGRRFMIENATVWNLLDEETRPYGQAATFSQWHYLDDDRRS